MKSNTKQFASTSLRTLKHGAQKFQKRLRNLFCLGWALNKPKKLQEKRTTQKLKAKKHKNKQLEKERTQKHEIAKGWKLTSSCCVVCVSPTSYKNKNTMNLYVRISSKKSGFLTHIFQETKLGSAIQAQFCLLFTQETSFHSYLL